MKTREATVAIADLAHAYDKFLAPRPGIQSAQAYELSSIIKAANALAEKIAAGETSAAVDDSIPF